MQDKFSRSLKELLHKELDLYKKLESAVAQEEALVEAQDWEELLLLLEDKQTVIAEQEELQKSWGTLSDLLGLKEGRESASFWKEVKKKLDAKGYDQVTELVEELRNAVGSLISREEALRDKVEIGLGALRSKMLQMQKGKTAYRSYAKMGGGNT